MFARRLLAAWLSSSALIAGTGCSGGSGGDHAGTTGFQLDDLSVQEGAVWQINREIVFRFSEPIDFTTVSSNTIQIRSRADAPAIGVFRLRDPFTVSFQPNCPTRDDFSDAGLQPGGVAYVLRVPGVDTSQNTLRSITGVALGRHQVRTFSTPASRVASIVFRDDKSGPPEPILRPRSDPTLTGTYLEVGGNPD